MSVVIEQDGLCVTVSKYPDSDSFKGRQINFNSDYGESVLISVQDGQGETKEVLITGIICGCHLHKATAEDESQSIKIAEGAIILSLGVTLISIDLTSLEVTWKLEPDGSGTFEFYDLEDDILLRGELDILRISKRGEIIWRYGGRDIWVNINGEPEVVFVDNAILLTDFEGNKYLIDYNGKTLEDRPFVRTYIPIDKNVASSKAAWWQFWKN